MHRQETVEEKVERRVSDFRKLRHVETVFPHTHMHQSSRCTEQNQKAAAAACNKCIEKCGLLTTGDFELKCCMMAGSRRAFPRLNKSVPGNCPNQPTTTTTTIASWETESTTTQQATHPCSSSIWHWHWHWHWHGHGHGHWH